MGWVEHESGRDPVRAKVKSITPPVVPSLCEALSSFSAVVLTGGSSGIGKSFIELGEKLNPNLLFCNLSRRAPAQKSCSQKLNHFSCDLAKCEDVEQAASQVVALLRHSVPSGRILLINNSGIGSYGPFPEPNLQRQLDLVDVNIRAVVHLTGLLLPYLKERGGVVMTIASTAAFQPTPYAATYAATKAFVLDWSMALGEELRGTGVSTIAVCPGPTATDFFNAAGLGKGVTRQPRVMSAEAVVEAALRGLAAGKSVVVPGWTNRLGAWASSVLPKAWAARVAGSVMRRYRLEHLPS